MSIPQNFDLREVYWKCDPQARYAMRVPAINDLRNAVKCQAIEKWAGEQFAAQRRSFRQQLLRAWWLVNS